MQVRLPSYLTPLYSICNVITKSIVHGCENNVKCRVGSSTCVIRKTSVNISNDDDSD